jgi:hypothetical protein
MCTLKIKYRIRQQHADWVTHYGTQEVFVCEKCSMKDGTAETTAVLISSSASAATNE